MSKNEVTTTGGNSQAGRDLINQIVGQGQALQAASDLLRTGGISKHAMVKEHKLYQQLSGMVTPHGAVLKGTWEDYCSLLGRSVDMVDRDIANLQAFGEEALEAMNRAGIGYRDLRQFRRLPVDEKAALIEAAQKGDKDTLLDLAEALISKNQKQQEEAGRTIDALTNKVTAVQTKLNDAEKSADALNKVKRLSAFSAKTQAIRDETLVLQGQAEYSASALKRLWEDALGEGLEAKERAARTEFVWFAAHAVTARMCELLRDMQESAPTGTATEATMAHALTPDEALHWREEWAVIESHLKAAELVRHERRLQDHPKDVGRPASAPLAGVTKAKAGSAKAAKAGRG